MTNEMDKAPSDPKKDNRNLIVRFFSNLGPGLITGAADDDPSGIATYSTAGALLGTGQLWTALITWPLMASVQFMCARIGMVTGEGLSGALHKISEMVDRDRGGCIADCQHHQHWRRSDRHATGEEMRPVASSVPCGHAISDRNR